MSTVHLPFPFKIAFGKPNLPLTLLSTSTMQAQHISLFHFKTFYANDPPKDAETPFCLL